MNKSKEITKLREQIDSIINLIDEFEQEQDENESIERFDPTDILNTPDIPYGTSGTEYSYLNVGICGADLEHQAIDCVYDESYYRKSNYIPKEYPNVAEELLNITKFNMFLIRQKLIYCPDYVPNWNNLDEYKYYIKYGKARFKERDIFFLIRQIFTTAVLRYIFHHTRLRQKSATNLTPILPNAEKGV